MLISVIVPTLNETANLPVTLRQLAERTDVELIVVDGGSTDETVALAREFTPYVFVSQPGAAHQMNMGARHATGDILLFLHADTFLLAGALDEMKRRIIGDGAVGGAFDLQIDSPRRLFKVLAQLINRRARWLRLPRGNQGIFVWRQVFEQLGGFPDLPILEDRAFVLRLRRTGRLTFIASGVIASARHWQVNGLFKTVLARWCLATLFFLRVSPQRLRRLHDHWLGGDTAADTKTVPLPSSR